MYLIIACFIVFDLLVDDPYIQDYRLCMFSDHEMIIHLKLGKHKIGDYTNKYKWDVLTVKITLSEYALL